jgi:hypothetical protein
MYDVSGVKKSDIISILVWTRTAVFSVYQQLTQVIDVLREQFATSATNGDTSLTNAQQAGEVFASNAKENTVEFAAF